MFTEVNVTSNVIYGVNATVLLVPQTGEAVPIPLAMDIYEPVGDTETSRPLVLVYHTGNFLPNVLNAQISGTKTDSAVVEICTRLAKRGYVAAAVDYRTGWNPLAETQPIRALGLIQAAYRGIQDGRNAVRFFRGDAEDGGNTFGIDPNKITAWGNGTGGYLTLGMATLNNYLEIPTAQNGPGKFVLDLDGDGVPETPMVVEPFHGDIYGLDLTVTPIEGFGLPAGDTTNYPNHVTYNSGDTILSDVTLCVNIGGALADVSWIDDVTPPIITVQSVNDIFAPYDDATLIVPTTGDPIVRVQGGQKIHPAMQALGTHDIFNNAFFDDAVTTTAIANAATAGHDYWEGLFPWVQAPNSLGLDEGVVLDWWDPNAPAPGAGMNIPWNLLPHPSGNGTYHEVGMFTNENMSAEKAKGNITMVMDYTLPRMCVALDLPCADIYSSTNEVALDASVMSVFPNPVSTELNINAKDRIIQKVDILNVDGRLFTQKTAVNSSNVTISNNTLPSGIYFIKVYFEDGVATQRVIFE